MSFRKPGRRVSWTFVSYTALLAAALALFPLYRYYKQAAAPLPPGVTLAGVALPGMKDPAAMRAVLEPIFQQPVGVRFEDRILILQPGEVDFRIDFDATLAEAARYLEGPDFVDIAVREALGLPQQRRDAPLHYSLDQAKLRAWLEKAATQLDYAPVSARVALPQVTLSPEVLQAAAVQAGLAVSGSITGTLTGTLTGSGPAAAITDTASSPAAPQPTPTPQPIRKLAWMPGVPGHKIDIDASLPQVVAALASSDQRSAELALIETPPSAPTLAELEEQLPRVLDTFPVFTAVSVHDLATGGRAQADGDAAFSGMTTMKIPLMTALMIALPNGIAANDAQAQQVGEWIDRAIGQGDDLSANKALAWLGGGDEAAGARQLTDFMHQLGLVNTFMQGGIGATAAAPLTTPSNQRPRPNTRPDANMQTTPDDLATLLGAIYDCTQDRGKLREVFRERITPQECSQILFYMSHNELRDSLWRGIPDYEKHWVVHQQGLSYEQHGNAALVWGPTGPYAISIFIYNPSLTDSSTSNQAIADLSRMIWEFFDFIRVEGKVDPGPAPVLEPPPGYAPIDKYVPSAANPQGR